MPPTSVGCGAIIAQMNPHGKTKIAKSVFFLRKGQIFRRPAPSDIDDYPLIVMGSGAGDTPVSPQHGARWATRKELPLCPALPLHEPSRGPSVVLRQKENAPKGMDASKMNAPKVAQNMAGMQAYLGE